MPFVEGAPYRDSDSEAPLGAAEFGPRREPRVPSEASLPLPRRAGEGEEKGVGPAHPRAFALGHNLPPLSGLVRLTSRITGTGH